MRIARLLSALILLLVGLVGFPARSEEPPVVASRLLDAGEDAPSWTGPQVIGADGDGQVFVLRAEPLTVYPIATDGRLGKPRLLALTDASSGVFRDASLSHGGRWLVWIGQDLFLFTGEKGQKLPATAWRVETVGFRGERPIVGVLPQLVGSKPPGFHPPKEPPLVLELRGKRWVPLLSEPLDGADPRESMELVARRAVRLLGDSQELWLARAYRSRVERLVEGTRRTVRDDPESVEWRGSAIQDEELRKELEREGMALEGAQTISFNAPAVFQALTESPDGLLYALNSRDGGKDHLALERYQPGEDRWERASLAIAYSGRLSMAAGADGLYIAAWQGHLGRWVIPWEALADAEWQEIADKPAAD